MELQRKQKSRFSLEGFSECNLGHAFRSCPHIYLFSEEGKSEKLSRLVIFIKRFPNREGTLHFYQLTFLINNN